MNTKTAAPTLGVSEQKRNEKAMRFVKAHLQLVDAVEVMFRNAHAVTLDPATRASLNLLIGQIVTKQNELASLMDSLFYDASP